MGGAGGGQFDQMIATQIISMGFMNGGTAKTAIASFIILKLVQILTSFLPVIQEFVKKWFDKWYNEKYGNNKLMSALINNGIHGGEDNSKKEIKALIKFEYKREVNSTDVTMQAIMNYISESDACNDILYSLQFYVINENEFKIADKVYCRVTLFENDDKGFMDKYCFELYSYEMNIYKLRAFVDNIVVTYRHEQNNQLGNAIYFFDEMHVDIPMSMDGQMRLEMAPKNMTFTMAPFNTNKSLSNLYGKHLNVAKERVHRFVNKPEWYAKKGIPHTLGIMLYGPPGSGKTSFIKATAKDLNRHIINLKIQKSTTKTQLMDLFFNTELTVLRNGRSTKIYIPLDKRIYIMEDIDSLTDIVLDRKIQFKRVADKLEEKMSRVETGPQMVVPSGSTSIAGLMNLRNGQLNGEMQNGNGSGSRSGGSKKVSKEDVNTIMQKQQAMNPDALNLSFLLNLLDGILETPGRVLIITTNHPEKLDSALIRPGRVDVPLCVGHCNCETLEEMLEGYYEVPIELREEFKKTYKKTITPAEVYAVMQNNDNTQLFDMDKCIENCLDELLAKSNDNNKKKTGEDEEEQSEKDREQQENQDSIENMMEQIRQLKEQLAYYEGPTDSENTEGVDVDVEDSKSRASSIDIINKEDVEDNTADYINSCMGGEADKEESLNRIAEQLNMVDESEMSAKDKESYNMFKKSEHLMSYAQAAKGNEKVQPGELKALPMDGLGSIGGISGGLDSQFESSMGVKIQNSDLSLSKLDKQFATKKADLNGI